MKNKLSTRGLTLIGMLVALAVVCSRFLAYQGQLLKISATFLPLSLIGMLFGPFWGGIGSAVADVTGSLLFPSGPFFPGFTLNAFITGLIYGVCYYKKKMSWLRALVGTLLVSVIVHTILTPLWLSTMYGVDLTNHAFWVTRLTKEVIAFPIEVVSTYFMGQLFQSAQFKRLLPYK